MVVVEVVVVVAVVVVVIVDVVVAFLCYFPGQASAGVTLHSPFRFLPMFLCTFAHLVVV